MSSSDPSTSLASRLSKPSKLSYSIHSSSGYTASYVPQNILIDAPADQSSRWTGASTISTSSTFSTSSDDPERKPVLHNGRGKKESQFVTIELERPAVVQLIGFGKYQKTHPCNLAEFAVSGGMSPNPRYMEPLFHGGLKNDSAKESFELVTSEQNPRSRDEVLLPVKYIRIDAIAAHSANYNTSIWHVWLEGCNDPDLLKEVVATYELRQRTTTDHLLLAHLRRTQLLSAYSTLLATLPSTSTATFEHPLASALHTALVLRGSYTGVGGAEAILEEILKEGLLDEWDGQPIPSPSSSSASHSSLPTSTPSRRTRKGRPVARWEQLDAGPGPCARGGHQMVRIGRKLLLHGGWDGTTDLEDLWELDLPRTKGDDNGIGKWRCLHSHEEGVGVPKKERKVPKARSCHQLAVDEGEGWVYLLGGMGPMSEPKADPLEAKVGNGNTEGDGMDVEGENGEDDDADDEAKNDFWRYKAVGKDAGKWELLSEDVRSQNGPARIFDHQMVVDSGNRLIYVFGGKHIEPGGNPEGPEGSHSGMYVYSIARKDWTLLFNDSPASEVFKSDRLLSRIGHSMLIETNATDANWRVPFTALYILAGQRGERYLSDLWTVRIAEHPSSMVPAFMLARNPSSTAGSDLWRGGGVFPALGPEPRAARMTSADGEGKSDSARVAATQLLTADVAAIGGPPAGFTQRTCRDSETGEWTLLSGLIDGESARNAPTAPKGSMGTGKGEVESSPQVWLRDARAKWEQIEVKGDAPQSRFGAPVAYDPLRKEHYLHGGNPQDGEDGSKRLNDFWRLRLIRPSPKETLRAAKFLVRKQRFTEMCKTQPTITALTYLQTTLSAVVDHSDPEEAAVFRSCMSAILSAPAENMVDEGMHSDAEDDQSSERTDADGALDFVGQANAQRTAHTVTHRTLTPELYRQRHELFEHLMDFLPDWQTQPRENLQDLAAPRWDQYQKGRFD